MNTLGRRSKGFWPGRGYLFMRAHGPPDFCRSFHFSSSFWSQRYLLTFSLGRHELRRKHPFQWSWLDRSLALWFSLDFFKTNKKLLVSQPTVIKKESTYICFMPLYQYLRHAIKLGLFVLYFLLYELFFLFAQVHLVHFDHELVPGLLLLNLFILLPRILGLNVGFNTFSTLSCTISWLDLLASCSGLLLLGCSLLLVLLLLRLAGMLLHPIKKPKTWVSIHDTQSRYTRESWTKYLLAVPRILLRYGRALSVLALISRHLLVLLLGLCHVSCCLFHWVVLSH